MKKILIVEDDILLNKTLSYNLALEGYQVESSFSIEEAKANLSKHKFGLIILDVNLPDGNGFDLCKEIRSDGKHIPLIFLTANDMESDMLKGYELGATDYVTKPFHISVFQKKVKAIFNMTSDKKSAIFDDGHLKIDFSSHATLMDGEPMILTPLEYRTLKVFVSHNNIVLTRQILLEKLWDVNENFVDEHTLTSTISRIRSKIETNDVQYIKTIYGMGYMWIGGGEIE